MKEDFAAADFDARAARWDENPAHAARTAAIAAGIVARVPLTPAMQALEIGCGTGQLSFALRKRVGSIVMADPSEGMIDVVKGRIAAGDFPQMEAMVLDLDRGPLPSGSYDLVYSQMALHHIPDVAKHLAALHGLMAPGGTLCIADLDSEDGSFHGHGFHGHKGFDRAELATQAVEVGFEAVEIETAYPLPREIEGELRHFPIFLLTARKTENASGQNLKPPPT